MKLDFIEIGTSNFKTLIQDSTDNSVGISVEPIAYYLNQLPDKKNVIKENAAISFFNSTKDIEIFYIPENIILKNKLPKWLKGCNSIGNYHPIHEQLSLTCYVEKQVVKQITIAMLLEKYNVESIDFLKIDTEGGDCYILNNLMKYLQNKSKLLYPKKITFETNRWTPEDIIEETISLYQDNGYFFKKRDKENTTLIFKQIA